MTTAHLAIDLGASSGRAIIGVLEGSPARLRIEEVSRFEHTPGITPAGPVWDLTGIWNHITVALKRAVDWCSERTIEFASVGVDTWGVDWALVGTSGDLLSLPHCYRDPRNVEIADRVLEKMGGRDALYARTGIQHMPLNTIFQVAARHIDEPRLFDAADRLLFLPDLFHYWLSGEMSNERTIASTSSMLDVETGEWDSDLIAKLGLPEHLFSPLEDPGFEVGMVRDEIEQAIGAVAPIRVVAPAAHDTASAVAAVPFAPGEAASSAYLSSGTWSLLGIERESPLASPEAGAVPLTNERGVAGTVRVLKNIAGLWLVQELRRELLASGRNLSFAEMTEQAAAAEPFRTIVDPDFPDFALPGDMSGKVQRYAEATGQQAPENVGQFVRCCLEGLALGYRRTIDQVEKITGAKIETLHAVGGGVNNRLLSQFAAEAIHRPVICGPTEATAIGNLLMQAYGCGAVADRHEIREVVARSFETERFEAGSNGSGDWSAAQSTFAQLVARRGDLFE
ncbi:Rhamnulokinase [Pseudobythopirellula maris]|uniref:Rhamnulokinase n=1 Tax=Pseudobythopirellula maris TaxID=2527991 RepID=A0A5C5ZID8_9BACT|nr:rhamnulokinase family protein [Pseudobythopirellula maris]TWT87169.1 Rhamnulokinase [Pseudobythopirellula maris]